uniref:Uncharacterized protein n=1 Tax=Cannabis sativa TaxID=3483 RepID=A0A803RAR7_CANSA
MKEKICLSVCIHIFLFFFLLREQKNRRTFCVESVKMTVGSSLKNFGVISSSFMYLFLGDFAIG